MIKDNLEKRQWQNNHPLTPTVKIIIIINLIIVYLHLADFLKILSEEFLFISLFIHFDFHRLDFNRKFHSFEVSSKGFLRGDIFWTWRSPFPVPLSEVHRPQSLLPFHSLLPPDQADPPSKSRFSSIAWDTSLNCIKLLTGFYLHSICG